MNALTTLNTNATLTMSSREIAELTGKLHTHVLRDARKMFEELGLTESNFGSSYIDPTGRALPCFNLPKDLTITLVSGYNVQIRYAITKRWMELEEQVAAKPALPTTYLAALEELVQSVKEKETLRVENEEMKPDAKVGAVLGQRKHLTVVDFVGRFPGVNKSQIQNRLGELGYLQRQTGTWTVRSQYHDKLLANRYSPEGFSVVVVLEKGKKKLVDLYLNGQFVMKKGETPVSADSLEDILNAY